MFVRSLFALCLFASLTVQAQQSLLRSGPMLGYAQMNETVVWLQLYNEAEVTLRYQREGGEPRVATVRADASTRMIARFTLTELKSGATYTYTFDINGQPVDLGRPLTFKTQPHWQYRTDPPPVKFLIGSCYFYNHPEDDRPGRGYGGNYNIFKVMHETGGDFMIWTGDNVYYREPDFFAPSKLDFRNAQARALTELQPLLSSMNHYATWDDHDYGPNDSHRGYVFKGEALQLFKDYWANPSYGMPGHPGVYGHIAHADLDIFLMDDRYYRAPNRLKDPNKDYFGAEQLQWLKDNLAASRATFKIVVNGNQMINVHSRHEAFNKFRGEYDNFMRWLNDADIWGVVFLTGDRHFTELLKMDRARNYPLYEFTSSPLTSGTISSRLGEEEGNPLRVEGTLVTDERNFGVIEVTGPRRDRVMKFSTIDATGKLRWSHEIKATDLRPPQN